MSDSLAFILAFIGVALLVGVAYMLPGGCSGDCNQGRNCTCKDNQDGI